MIVAVATVPALVVAAAGEEQRGVQTAAYTIRHGRWLLREAPHEVAAGDRGGVRDLVQIGGTALVCSVWRGSENLDEQAKR